MSPNMASTHFDTILKNIRIKLPIQNPLHSFVHNNVLMMFEGKEFHEALAEAGHLYRARSYWQLEKYKAKFDEKKISFEDIKEAIDQYSLHYNNSILTGLQADPVAARGAYLHMMVISLSGTSLWSLISYVQRYTSVKRLNQFYGLAQHYPKLAVLFCLFGFTMIGTPLGAAFVVEDLVITGLLEQHPFLGLGHILATCLNGILFFLVFSKLFLGRTSYPQKIKNMDMSLSQMIPYVLVLLLMFSIGIFPSLFLENLKW